MASAFLGAMVAAGRMVASQAAATVGQASDAGSGEQGGAEGSAFFGFEEFDGVAVDVGLDLTPEGPRAPPPPRRMLLTGMLEFARRG